MKSEYRSLDRYQAEIEPIRDCNGDGSYLLAPCRLFGVLHHLNFVRVRAEDGVWVADSASEVNRAYVEDVYRLYDNPLVPVGVPGYTGQYLAFLHPYSR